MKSLFWTITFLVLTSIAFSQSDREFLHLLGKKSKPELEQLREQLKTSASADELKTRTKIKIIDFSFLTGPESLMQRIEILNWITRNQEEGNEEFLTWAHYHLGATLVFYELYDLAIEENERCLRLAKKNHNDWMTSFAYSNLAITYYKLKDYNKAKYYYRLCSKSTYPWPNYFFASNFNNLGLCEHFSGNYASSIHFYQLGLKKLGNSPEHLPKTEKEVYYLLKGNMGASYTRIDNYAVARKNLTEELNYYNENGISGFNKATCLIDFVRLYKRTGELDKIQGIIDLVLQEIPKLSGINDKKLCGDKLMHVLEEENIVIDKFKLMEIYTQIIQQANTETASIQRELTKSLYEDKIESLKENAAIEKRNFHLEQNNERLKFYGAVIAIILIVIIGLQLYRNNKRKLMQSELALLVKTQKEEIVRNEQIILEQQILNQKQQLNSLFTNLSIKQKTESGFLEKIKELKRNKNASSETIFRELQLELNNLLDIDKKLITEVNTDIEINEEISEIIRQKHPDLTKSEITMCIYFISDLSAKEIGLLMKISDISVRVAKNKIKNKIGLNKSDSLNEYLKTLT